MNPQLVAWLLTVGIEVPCVALFYQGERRKMAAVAAISTSLTNLPMNLLLPRLLGTGALFLIVGETGALLLEALVYLLMSRSRDPGTALAASALANSLSFASGFLLH